MELAGKIRPVLPNVKIIFITSPVEYAIDAFELSIFRYVPKNGIARRLPGAICLVVFWGLHIAGFRVEIAPFIRYLMFGVFSAGDNRANLENMLMLPCGRPGDRYAARQNYRPAAPGPHGRLRLLYPASQPQADGHSPPSLLCGARPVSCRCSWDRWRPGSSCPSAFPSSP